VLTDGRTDGRKEKSITIYLASSLRSLGGYKYTSDVGRLQFLAITIKLQSGDTRLTV